MPFYEYECGQCRSQVEVMQKISDSPLRKCPSCGKSALKRLISAPVFRLKGSGWYETDFKGDKDNKRNLAEARPAQEDSTPADKPAEKAADKPADKPAAAVDKPADKASDKPAAKPVAGASTAKRSARKAAPAKAAKKKAGR